MGVVPALPGLSCGTLRGAVEQVMLSIASDGFCLGSTLFSLLPLLVIGVAGLA